MAVYLPFFYPFYQPNYPTFPAVISVRLKRMGQISMTVNTNENRTKKVLARVLCFCLATSKPFHHQSVPSVWEISPGVSSCLSEENDATTTNNKAWGLHHGTGEASQMQEII